MTSLSRPFLKVTFPRAVARGRLALVAATALAVFFWRLGAAGLMDPDEGRYAEMAREMLVLGDWLLPHLNDVPYLEKPPLVPWLIAVSFGLFGLTEFAARLPVALSAVAGVLLAYALGRRWWGETAGFWAALVLATCGGYVALGRLLTLDMTLALFLNAAVAWGYLAYEEERRGLLLPAYASLALAVLTKGPVALVLAVLILGSVSLGERRRRWTFWLSPGGLLLCAALSLPWFFWVSLSIPEFPRYFFWDHHVGRFATAPIHPEPFYYYLPVLLAALLPWTPLLPGAVLASRAWADPRGRFLLLWGGAILGFYSLSQGKLAPYILPVLLPMALLLGRALALSWPDRALTVGIAAWLGIGLLAAGLYIWMPAAWAREVAKTAGLGEALPLAIGVGVAGAALALLCRRRWPLGLGAAALALTAALILGLISTYRSPREAGLAAAARVPPEALVVGVRVYSQALSFYLRRPFYLFQVTGELEFGLSLRPEAAWVLRSWEEVTHLARTQPQVLFLVRRGDLAALTQRLPGAWQEVARFKDCHLLSFTPQ
jgi:4-amino-4-deoxy-L-arabinose transferase-like glycosyltransferase